MTKKYFSHFVKYEVVTVFVVIATLLTLGASLLDQARVADAGIVDVEELVLSARPAVFTILSKRTAIIGRNFELFEYKYITGGTGFFIDASGIGITNNHVVSDPSADHIAVTHDGREYELEVVQTDAVADLALVRIIGSNELFNYLTFGESDAIQINQNVISIGNDMDEENVFFVQGSVTGLDVSIMASDALGLQHSLSGLIQTNVFAKPGYSGGPVLDTNASVIGINVAMADTLENVSFAVPSSEAVNLINSYNGISSSSTTSMNKYSPPKTLGDYLYQFFAFLDAISR